MKAATQHQIQLGGRHIDYCVVRSKAAQKLRIRVGPQGVEVVLPDARSSNEVGGFLAANEVWILDQLERVERLRDVRRPTRHTAGQILFRGEPTLVRIEARTTRARWNMVDFVDGEILVGRGAWSETPVVRSLENWLRKQARAAIESHLAIVTKRLRQHPQNIYVMGQRTKWGNCSALRNLSFNWRLVLSPDFVLRYIVTHETVHLAIPDHSAKFWLTVQSLCRETERAKQWLCSHQTEMAVDLAHLVDRATESGWLTT